MIVLTSSVPSRKTGAGTAMSEGRNMRTLTANKATKKIANTIRGAIY